MLCAACGKVQDNKNGGLPDAGSLIDAAPVAGVVHVTVYDSSQTGTPAPNANVVFFNPDGSLAARATTDMNGQAMASVLPGSSVTAITVANTTEYQLFTVQAIQPGDDLILGIRNPSEASDGTFTVVFPVNTQVGTNGTYVISGPCGSTQVNNAVGVATLSGVLSVNESCKLAKMDIVVSANVPSNSGSIEIGYLEMPNVQFMAGGSTTLTGPYQPLQNFTASYTNINGNVTSLNTSRSVPDGSGPTVDGNATLGGATASTTFGAPLATTAAVVIDARNANNASQEILRNVAGNVLSLNTDMSTLLPWFGAPSFDATNKKLSIPLDTTGTSMDAPDIFLAVARYDHSDGTNPNATFQWFTFGPTPGDIPLPQMPADLAFALPTATDKVDFLDPGVMAVEADAIPSYDAVRHDLGTAFIQYTNVRPPGQTVRISSAPSVRL